MKKKTEKRNRKPINMIGYEFQTWKVISISDKKASGNNQYWLCECQVCGKQKCLCGTEIRLGRTGQCRHVLKKQKSTDTTYYKTEQSLSNTIKNEIGKSYGRLQVVSFAYTKNSHAYWNCQCKCGKTCIIKGNALRNGEISSCGCLVSYQEERISQLLDELKIQYKQEFVFEDLRDKSYLRFDFAIFHNDKLVGLIEYQGRQHYDEPNIFNNFGILQKHDEMKRNYCLQKHIPLLELNKDNNLNNDILNWYNQII